MGRDVFNRLMFLKFIGLGGVKNWQYTSDDLHIVFFGNANLACYRRIETICNVAPQFHTYLLITHK